MSGFGEITVPSASTCRWEDSSVAEYGAISPRVRTPCRTPTVTEQVDRADGEGCSIWAKVLMTWPKAAGQNRRKTAEQIRWAAERIAHLLQAVTSGANTTNDTRHPACQQRIFEPAQPRPFLYRRHLARLFSDPRRKCRPLASRAGHHTLSSTLNFELSTFNLEPRIRPQTKKKILPNPPPLHSNPLRVPS